MLASSPHHCRIAADEGSGDFVEAAQAGGETAVAHAEIPPAMRIGLLSLVLTALGLELKTHRSTSPSREKRMSSTIPMSKSVSLAMLMARLRTEPGAG